MRIFARAVLVPCSVVTVLLALSACTVKASFKASSDAMTDFVSSTSGHAWLTQDGLIKAEHKLQAFVTVSFENLQQDMAQGRGEYLVSLWALLGGTHDQEDAFFTRTQETYTRLAPSQQTTPDEMLVSLTRVLASFLTINKTSGQTL